MRMYINRAEVSGVLFLNGSVTRALLSVCRLLQDYMTLYSKSCAYLPAHFQRPTATGRCLLTIIVNFVIVAVGKSQEKLDQIKILVCL